jgi:hypothetical protein
MQEMRTWRPLVFFVPEIVKPCACQKKYRLKGAGVEIFRRGDEIVLREKAQGLVRAFKILTELSDDFSAALILVVTTVMPSLPIRSVISRNRSGYMHNFIFIR